MGYVQSIRKLLMQVAKPGMVVAEVGVWKGEATIGYADIIAQNNGTLIVVDTFCGAPTVFGSHAYNPMDSANICCEFISNVVHMVPNLVMMKADSSYAASMLQKHILDFCFIDADHRYSAVKNDIANYIPLIKSGGIISGHDLEQWYDDCPPHSQEELEIDYSQEHHFGVSKAVSEWFRRDQVEMMDGTVWAVVMDSSAPCV